MNNAPKNLDDCFRILDQTLNLFVILLVKSDKEENMINYHHGLGQTIRNGFGLWKDSHLCKWFKKQGITHPDDMSGIILTSYWRYLNSKPID